MNIMVAPSYQALSRKAAIIVAGQLYTRPESVLGFATGSTPLGMYQELCRMHRDEGLSFRHATSFNLDEYVGLQSDDVNSYAWYMQTNLFSHVDIPPNRVHLPNGLARDIEQECQRYEQLISSSGGIDIQVLGIGKNGHIGFNEPQLKFEAKTHLVELDNETIEANSRFFTSVAEVPRHAISMGIKTIMLSRRILLLASGLEKARAIYRCLYGPITPDVPASILQLHQEVTVIVDKDAASLLPVQNSAPSGAFSGSTYFSI